jgi:SulP family sulfate permease
MRVLKGYLPILDWGVKYNRKTFGADMVVALIVTMMLIPHSLAYAMLDGLHPEVGL